MNVQEILNRNADRLSALYSGADQSARYAILADRFREHYHGEPEMFVSAPGRIEVVGNHTDHNNGRVLAASVDLDTVAAIAPNGTNVVSVLSEGHNGDRPLIVDLTDLDVHEDEKETSTALIRGVAARLKALGYGIGGFNAEVTSTVFKGSGLSSSAAFEVMLVAAFDALFNDWTIDPKLNARISQYAENVYFGKPCGLMDQTASAVGGLVAFDFAPEEAEVSAVRYDFNRKGYKICVVSAGGEHGNLSYAYAAIPAEMKAVAAALGEKLMNGVSRERLMAALPELKNQVSDRSILRAFHFVDETERVTDAVNALKMDDLRAFFKAVVDSGDSSWKLLQNLHVESSDNQEIPLALEMSRRMLEGRGAWRINGGGFAGTIEAYVPSKMVKSYSAAMNAVFGENAVTVLNLRPEGVVCIR